MIAAIPGIAKSAPGSLQPPHWVSLYDGYAGAAFDYDLGRSLAVSPDGSKLFVTGDTATVAYDAASGAELWVSPNDGAPLSSIVASPEGSRLFVTGSERTIAFDAGNGGELWTSPYPGTATSIAVSPDGSRVFVTGTSPGVVEDYATVAYDAVTGAELWIAGYDGPQHLNDHAYSVGVSPDGARVFVTGQSCCTAEGATDPDYATVAYDAVTGAAIWVSRYDGPDHYADAAAALAVSPDGSSVFVTGRSYASDREGYATIRYDAANGAALWVGRHEGGAARSVVVSPDGSRVFVSGLGYTTVAYDAATGAEVWKSRYRRKESNHALALAASPDGTTVFVTGYTMNADSASADYATVAYDAASGKGLWVGVYDGAAHDADFATAIAASSTGSRVFVTGGSTGSADDFHYATIAYPSAAQDPTACLSVRIPVALTPAEAESEFVEGDLCGPPDASVAQILVSGSTYGRVYWDFPFEPERYSYVRALTGAGCATLNVDRLGVGESSYPPSARITVDTDAFVVHQLVRQLRAGTIGGQPFDRVLVVGHSHGSLVGLIGARRYRDVDGLILTALAHNPNVPNLLLGGPPNAEPAILEARFAGRPIDAGYITYRAPFRFQWMHDPASSDPQVVALDEALKETQSGIDELSEVVVALEATYEPLDVPVLVAFGGHDLFNCGEGATDCSSAETVRAAEAPYYGGSLDAYVLDGAGHAMNLARNAPEWFAAAAEWTERFR
ncbi:MAG: PQQ-binding-like beta-propeller repeat protein [Candidatus Binatia bacterium]